MGSRGGLKVFEDKMKTEPESSGNGLSLFGD